MQKIQILIIYKQKRRLVKNQRFKFSSVKGGKAFVKDEKALFAEIG